MSDGPRVTRRLLYALPDLAWIVLICILGFAAHDLANAWLWVIVLMTFPSIWSPVSEWLVKHSNKHHRAISWKDPANMAIALVVVVVASLLVGWAVERLAELLGHWVRVTWVLLGAALAIASMIGRAREKRSTVANSQEK